MNLASVSEHQSQSTKIKRNPLNKRLPRIGRVLFSEYSAPVNCAVKNFSEEKAVLTMSGWLGLPSEFTMYIEPDNIRTQCTVASRRGSNIEVALSNIERDVRYSSTA